MTVAQIMNCFLRTFYLETVSLSVVYTPTSNLVLHSICSIATCFKQYRDNELLKQVLEKIEAKFNKYWSTIPYLYSFSFNLDPHIRTNGLFDILTLIGGHMGKNYIQTCYNDAQKRFATVYRSYEEEFQSDEM